MTRRNRQPPASGPASKRWRRPVALFTAVPVILLLGWGALAFRLPERWVIAPLFLRATGARVEAEITRWRPLTLDALYIYDARTGPGGAPDALTLPPLARAGRMQISWRPGLPGTRLIPEMALWNLHVHPVVRSDGVANFDFLRRPRQGESSGRDMGAFIPQRVTIHDGGIRADLPEGSLWMHGIDLFLNLDSVNALQGRVHGENIRAGWQSAATPEPEEFLGGAVMLDVRRNGMAYAVSGTVALPGMMTADGRMGARFGERPDLRVDVDALQLQGQTIAPLLSALSPVPFAFESLRVEPLELDAAWEAGRPAITALAATATANGLRLGRPERPWYAGSATLTAAGAPDAEDGAGFTLVLDRGREVRGTFHTTADSWRVEADFDEWRRSEWLELIPAYYAERLAYVSGLKGMQGSMRLSRSAPGYAVELNVETDTAVTTPARLNLRAEYLSKPGNIAGEGTMTLGNGTVDVSARHEAGGRLEITGETRAVALPEWVHALLHREMAGWQLTPEARFVLQRERYGAPIDFRISGDAGAPSLGAWTLPDALAPLHFEGTGRLSANDSLVALERVELRCAESARLTLEQGTYDARKRRLEGTLSGSVELPPWTAWLGHEEWWGQAEIAAAVSMDESLHVTLDTLRVSLDPFGYGDYALPYGQPLIVETSVRLGMNPYRAETGPIQARLGADTRLEIDRIVLDAEGTTEIPMLRFATEFMPIVAKQYLASAQGTLTVSANGIRYRSGTLDGDLVYECAAAQLVLPGNFGELADVALSGRVNLGNASGGGPLRIGEIRAAGVTARELQGNLRVTRQAVFLDELAAGVFGGRLTGQVELRPLESGMPVRMRGDLGDIDLSLFTSEYNPPSLMLTGRVNGTFDIALTRNTLTGLDVRMTALEGFSVNRDMVEQILLSQYVGQMTGQQIERMVLSVIGPAPQRSFDRAELRLGLEGERITGYIKLESRTLDLTVDIKADPQAVIEALRARNQ